MGMNAGMHPRMGGNEIARGPRLCPEHQRIVEKAQPCEREVQRRRSRERLAQRSLHANWRDVVVNRQSEVRWVAQGCHGRSALIVRDVLPQCPYRLCGVIHGLEADSESHSGSI